MITIVVANHFPNTSPWDKFNKLTKYWLSGKKITFVHGCLKCGNLKLTIRGQSPPYSLYYFLPDTSDQKSDITNSFFPSMPLHALYDAARARHSCPAGAKV
jgi:hypothetical protein